MNHLVSINVTTYNRAHLLPRCIDSILNQSYKHIEIIIVDDGSSDGTQTILNSYKSVDNRFKIFRHEKNRGNSYARNTALDMSKGVYIAFMDDDDEWIDNNKISKQVEIFENNKVNNLGIVCSNVVLVTYENETSEIRVSQPRNIRKFILTTNNIYSPTVLTKRSILIQAGGFDNNLQRGIDSDFYRKCILSLKYQVYYLDEYTTRVYIHRGPRMSPNSTVSGKRELIKNHVYILKKYLPYFIKYPSTILFRLKRIISASHSIIIPSYYKEKKSFIN